ncbi:hypothetical protein PA01_18945 [Azoarcus sp. PA01]|nr:hypothetical protein PA01_18945 [Azoarcus sp. PA01]
MLSFVTGLLQEVDALAAGSTYFDICLLVAWPLREWLSNRTKLSGGVPDQNDQKCKEEGK